MTPERRLALLLILWAVVMTVGVVVLGHALVLCHARVR